MSLFSTYFIIFLIVIVLFYFTILKNRQWVCLLIASYLFYIFCGGLKTLPFLIITTISTFIAGILLEKTQKKYECFIKENKDKFEKHKLKQLKVDNRTKKRIILSIFIIFNLGILAVLKYSGFIVEQINHIFTHNNLNKNIVAPNLLLPLGISFYTFQSIGYIIDVYRGKIKADKDIFKFALFVSYFPQIIQGPISRYNQLANQLYDTHQWDYKRAKFGIQRMLFGYFKKLIIAERATIIVDAIFNNPDNYSGFIIFFAAFLYGFQIYADFSGGIDIIIGTSEILGIKMEENFKQPFMAKSIADYWQRWHITLGAWMRDYLFYPLALSKKFNKLGKKSRSIFGNQVGKILPAVIASFIVFLCVGIWHGASWKYIFYGIYNAFFVSSGTLFEKNYIKIKSKLKITDDLISWRIFQTARTIFLVTVGRYMTRADSFTIALKLIKNTLKRFDPWVIIRPSILEIGGIGIHDFTILFLAMILWIIIDILHENNIQIREYISKQDIVFRWTLYFIGIFSIIIFGKYGLGYAARFIYQGF